MSRKRKTQPTTADRLTELTDAISRLVELEPLERAIAAKELIGTARRVLGDAQREAVYEATRERSYVEVADALGVTTAAVNVAITTHRKVASVSG